MQRVISRILLPLLACGVVALSTDQASARAVPPVSPTPNVHAGNCDGIAARVTVPAANFDPLLASDSDLALNGYPPRGDAAFAKVTAHPIKWQSDIHCVPGVLAGGATSAPALARETSSATQPSGYPPCFVHQEISYNWSGNVNCNDVFTDVEGEWFVPTVVSPSSLTAVSSIWVGMGTGLYTTDALIQAGTEQDNAERCFGACDTTSYYSWFQVPPYNAHQNVTNLPVSPGDEFYVHAIFSAKTRVAGFHMVNVTKGIGINVGETLTDQQYYPIQAEYIVERTEVCGGNIGSSCSYPSLMNFGQETIFDAQAARGTEGISFVPAANMPHYYNTMYDKEGTQLAFPGGFDSTGKSFADRWINYGKTDPAP